MALLEHCVREDLNIRASRVMAVLDPLKIVITNFPEGEVEQLEAVNNPEDASAGVRSVPFTRELYIEQEDFMENPPGKFFRLAPGKEVRLRYAYIIKCEEVIKDAEGKIVELHCTYDPETRSGMPQANRKVKGTLHWVSATGCIDTEVRLYEQLFTKENPDDSEDGKDFLSNLNPDSLQIVRAKVEPSLSAAVPGTHFQFERKGYFTVDTLLSTPGTPVFNRTVTLRDTWAKMSGKQ
jgi:glutaminyl-tRNA synthetase